MSTCYNKLLCFSFLFFLYYSVISQPKCNYDVKFENASYSVCIFPADSNSIKSLSLVQNPTGLKHSDFIDEYISNHDSIVFATNACIASSTGSPIGLFISNGDEVSSINLSDGSGNFFLKPNGVLKIGTKDIDVVESSSFSKGNDVVSAVQSGPMLVINGDIHKSFNPNSQNKNIRSGVGVFKGKDGKKQIVFVKSNDPVSFYDFARLFKELYNCKNALCLESTGSAIYTPEIGIKTPLSNNSIYNYLVYRKHPAKKKKTVIQMTKSPSGTYDIPVELNGVLKISFIFDSGASDVTISPDIALTLIKTGTITDNDFIGKQQYRFANGATATSEVFILHEIKIGDYKIKNVRASISNSINAPMLLGQSMLQRIGKFTIDNTNHTLTIE